MKRSHLFLVGLVAILSVSSLSYGWVFTTHWNSVVHLAKDPFISAYLDKYDLSVSLISAVSAIEPPETSQWGFCNNIDKDSGSLLVDYDKWPMNEVSVGRIIHMAMDCSVPSNHNPAGLLGFQSNGAELLVEGMGMFGRMPGSYPVCGAHMTYQQKRDIFYDVEVDLVSDYKAWYNGHSWLYKIFNPPFGYYDRGVKNGMTLAHAVLYDYFQIYDPDRGYGSGHRGYPPPFDCPDGDTDMPADAEGLDVDPDRIGMNPFETLDGQLEMFPSILGDANCDGVVDVSDLGVMATNYGATSGVEWLEGDFNFDGVVDVSDLGVLATNYGEDVSGAPVPTPEPATMSLLGIGALALLRRRK